MVSVGIHVDNKLMACGGVLIGRQYVLTAAHCVKWHRRTFKPMELVVRVGAHYRTHYETMARDHKVESVTVHQNYTDTIYGYDIALIKLRNKVKFSRRVHPICLPPDNSDDYEGRVAMVSGWGHTAQGGVDSPVLMEVPVPVWKNRDCYYSYINTTKVTYNMLCAGYKKGSRDSCQGDSGGPLMVKSESEGRWVLIGVVSWGEGCARPNYPGVYTRVSEFIKWIREVIAQLSNTLTSSSSTFSTVTDTTITTEHTTTTTTSNHVNITTIPPIITTTGDNLNDWWDSQPLAKICGRGSDSGRIVGGWEAKHGTYPWMVGIKLKGSSRMFCGGTLIAGQYVLTAAHCFRKDRKWTENAGDIAVRVGAQDLRANESEARDHGVVSIRIPRNYIEVSKGYDIAVLKLRNKVKFSRRVHPICLPPGNSADDYAGAVAVLTGWGDTTEGGVTSPVLLEVPVQVWDNSACDKSLEGFDVISSMICAGDRAGGKDSCQGDSGGSLMLSKRSTTPQPPITKPFDTKSNDNNYLHNADPAKSTPSILPPSPKSSLNGGRCGVAHTRRIMGGGFATPRQYPWMAAILLPNKTTPDCGGALIGDRYVLTAAHCLHRAFGDSLAAGDLTVRLGAFDFGVDREHHADDYPVANYTVHDGYDTVMLENDLAIIKLSSKVNYTPTVHPICLPPKDVERDDYTHRHIWVAGWGRTSFKGAQSTRMKHVELPVWLNDRCDEALYDFDAKSKVFCTGHDQGGMDACQGDSGGPLMLRDEGDRRWRLVGVVSFGNECGLPNNPGVNTRVTEYLDWISEHTMD
ncbi:unnamed protein product [Oppiella nova]|uniref:Peptidase S1 domain-containing protein n=1 Tax=Oppiella nova TaxID=334625 RepID=A0A7R9M6P0_9ACAR|nr:unnamed protein product [Oppiella nova]CAG2171781.1 unnamed protein product [Oppiella nova]